MLGRRFSQAELVRSFSKSSDLQVVKGSLERNGISPTAYGYCVVTAGMFFMVPHSVFFRLSSRNTPGGTVLFWLFFLWGTAITLVVFWMERKKLSSFFTCWRWKLTGACFQAIGAITYTVSLQETSAANTLVFFSTQPLFAAILSAIILKEPLRRHTTLACVVSFAAIVYIFVGELGESADKIFGNAMALVAALTTALYSILIRHMSTAHKEVSMIICPGIGKLLAVPYGLIVQPSNLLDIATGDLPWMILNGFVTTPLAFILFTIGPKYIPAAEVGLLWLIETVLGPLLVYLGGFEKPSGRSFVGGAVIVVTLITHGVYTIRLREGATATGRSKVQMEPVSSFRSESVQNNDSFRSRVESDSFSPDNNGNNGSDNLDGAGASRSDSSISSPGNGQPESFEGDQPC